MRRLASYILVGFLPCMLVSCNNSEEGAPKDDVAGVALDLENVGLASVSDSESPSRVIINGDGNWKATNGDVITLVAYGSTYTDGNYNNWSRYRCEISGTDTAWNWNENLSGDFKIRINNVAATILGYYPNIGTKGMFHYSSLNNAPCISTTLHTKYTDVGADAAAHSTMIDYMYVQPKTGITNKQHRVSVKLNHAMAMLKLVIARDTSYNGTGYITNVIFGDTLKTTNYFKTGVWDLNLLTGQFQDAASGSSKVPYLEWSDYTTWGYYEGTVYHHIFNYKSSTDPAEDGRVVLRTMIAPIASIPKNLYTMKMMIDTKPIVLRNCIPDRPEGYKAGYCYTYYVRFTAKALIINNDVKVERWQSGDTGVASGELIAN